MIGLVSCKSVYLGGVGSVRAGAAPRRNGYGALYGLSGEMHHYEGIQHAVNESQCGGQVVWLYVYSRNVITRVLICRCHGSLTDPLTLQLSLLAG